ncbi:hypothetical protein K2X05_14065, partial [bacterium]|nr:hypothetical protein [bacterium]
MQYTFTERNYPPWKGQYLGGLLFLHFDSNILTVANNLDVLVLQKSEYTDFTAVHSKSVLVTFNSTTILLSENGEQFLTALDNEKIIHLQLLFQLVSLATDGSLFYPATLAEMRNVLAQRNLRIPEVFSDTREQCCKVIRIGYEYL